MDGDAGKSRSDAVDDEVAANVSFWIWPSPLDVDAGSDLYSTDAPIWAVAGLK